MTPNSLHADIFPRKPAFRNQTNFDSLQPQISTVNQISTVEICPQTFNNDTKDLMSAPTRSNKNCLNSNIGNQIGTKPFDYKVFNGLDRGRSGGCL